MNIYYVNTVTSWSDNTYLLFASDKEDAIDVVKKDVYKDITIKDLNELNSKEDVINFMDYLGAKIDDDFLDQFNDMEDKRVFATISKEDKSKKPPTHPYEDYECWGY
ncbi:MAG: hypothetical protein SLAVMIC_00364 [uncultured marine phage]|uniref:Uncharacterized protein n=1 Tax=uncultured marine phage TaxID=707152 RepID=A0A8D9C9W8_9VIRU|nr:MAG: hypothetical protein SLAVMIC_00364 [uncultured marine phage]